MKLPYSITHPLELINKKSSFLLINLLLLINSPAQGLLDSTIDGYINDLTIVWDRHNTSTFDHLFTNDTLTAETEFKLFGSEAPNKVKDLQLLMNEQEQEIYKKNIGLQLVGAYQQNFNGAAVDPNEIVVFRQKAQMGLEWNLLGQGLYDNLMKYNQLQYEKKAISAQRNAQTALDFQQKNNIRITNLFNQSKLQIVETRRQMLGEQKPIVDKLYALKQITKDNYIRLLQNQTDLDGQSYLYEDYNSATGLLPQIKLADNALPPLVDIDIAKLFLLTNTNMVDSSVFYFMDVLNHQGNYFLRDASLQTFVKYNFYDTYGTKIPQRSFVSVGMNFSLPLAFNYSNKRELNRLQAELIREKNTGTLVEDQKYFFINTFYDYRYKLKQYFNLLQQRKAYEELIRTEQVKQKMQGVEFNPNTALNILNDYWNSSIELLDLKQDMYKILLTINSKLPNSKVTDFIKPVENKYYRQTNKDLFKAVYIWSDAFRNYDIKLISDYCTLNEFTHLLVSYNPEKSYVAKLNEFISKNYTKTIALMIGSNKLLFNQNISSYLDSLKRSVDLTFVKEIHLDIEPHTQEGFKENKDLYFQKYLDLLRDAKRFTDKNKLTLSVSIPLHYPVDILKEIFAMCSNVYLMTYENVKPEHIYEKTKEEMALDPNKVVIALRTKDFDSRASMDQLFKTINAKKMAYHDLDDLISFDKKSINNTPIKEK